MGRRLPSPENFCTSLFWQLGFPFSARKIESLMCRQTQNSSSESPLQEYSLLCTAKPIPTTEKHGYHSSFATSSLYISYFSSSCATDDGEKALCVFEGTQYRITQYPYIMILAGWSGAR
jgi:hypothetical protein